MPAGYTGAVGTTPGASPVGYSPAYGGIPQVPSLLDIYGQGLSLGPRVTATNEQEMLNNLRMAIPGYDASVATSMGNISQLQHGQIPTDVRNLITQQAAERGISTGLYSSPNANAALLRVLGLTSLGLQATGEHQMTGLVARTPQAKPFDVPAYARDAYDAYLLANLYKSAPVPRDAANQLISDQMAGYKTGRGNVPSYSVGMPQPGPGYTPIQRDPIMPVYSALGPFDTTPTSSKPFVWNPRNYGPQTTSTSTGGLTATDEQMRDYFTEMYGPLPDEAQGPGLMDWVSGLGGLVDPAALGQSGLDFSTPYMY